MISRLNDLVRHPLLSVAVLLLACGALAAQGVQTRAGSSALYGSPANCSQPATIDYDAVKEKTPEWKKIVAEGLDETSGKYQILISQMNTRIRRACERVAQSEGRDCVMREGDITDDNGLDVADLTSKVKAAVRR